MNFTTRLAEFFQLLNTSPETLEFSHTLSFINAVYVYTPTAFKNGAFYNRAGENEGSCKIFSFALLNKLDQAQTLACFGTFYREDVVKNPTGDDHQNIRNFMVTGWAGIEFENAALKPI